MKSSSRRSLTYRLLYPWLNTFLIALAHILAPRFSVSGTRNVPRRGGVLLCPNHLSDCDPPFLFPSCPRALWFMAKAEIFEISYPIIGKLGPKMTFLGAFAVDPGEPDRESLRRAQELLQSGETLVVFPEGEVSQGGEMNEVLPGAVLLAQRSGVPIVPVGIWGTQHVIPYGQIIPRPTFQRVHVHFGAPISFDDLKTLPKREAREKARERLEAAIKEAREIARNGGS